MSSVAPSAIVDSMVAGGAYKASLSARQIVLRAFLAAFMLGAATTLSGTVATQTGIPFLGALVFPVGFVMVILLGLELVTGSFALVPLAVWERRSPATAMLRSFGLAICGHLLGAATYAVAFWAVITQMGTDHSSPVAQWVVALAEHKTVEYQHLGVVSGVGLVLIKAMLCNWLVSMGVVMSMASTDTLGKIVGMWLPVTMFFGLGFEHSVVNMFVIPAGMLLGADVSWSDWWLWNEIPALVGNLLGAVLLTSAGLYLSQRLRWGRPPVA